jgi:hypothetical protein
MAIPISLAIRGAVANLSPAKARGMIMAISNGTAPVQLTKTIAANAGSSVSSVKAAASSIVGTAKAVVK